MSLLRKINVKDAHAGMTLSLPTLGNPLKNVAVLLSEVTKTTTEKLQGCQVYCEEVVTIVGIDLNMDRLSFVYDYNLEVTVLSPVWFEVNRLKEVTTEDLWYSVISCMHKV